VTSTPWRWKTAAATITMAALMASPASIESSVSRNSNRSSRRVAASEAPCHCRLWITSECRYMLCGITTAPRTAIAITTLLALRLGTTMLWAVWPQSGFTSQSSTR
jgi:hypothetical protein